MIVRPILAVLAVAMVTGCASTRQVVRLPDQSKTIEDPSKARIYVLRTTSLGCGVSMKVTDTGHLVGKTGAKGFLCWERPPGNILIKSKAENTCTLPLRTEAGSVYYVHQQVRMGILYARNKLLLLPEQEGKKKLSKCNPPHIQY